MAGMFGAKFRSFVEAGYTVLGASYGGIITLYLAADHPQCAEHFVAAGAAGTISDWGRDVDYRWARARARGDKTAAGRIMAEYFFPEPSQARARAVVGAAMAPLFSAEKVSAADLMVEAEAEAAYDARAALPRISVPVLLVTGEDDLFFSRDIVDETVALIPDCTLIRYPGKGHMKSIMGKQLVIDVLEHVRR